ncbi:MAG TPA: hypothetical protein VF904_18885 [Anaeromyxobacteraceae bacterium]
MAPPDTTRTNTPDPGPGKSPAQRIAGWLAELREPRARRPGPAPRIPRRPQLRAPKPSSLSSAWSARLAVRAGIALEDFLRHRLARHLAALPVPPARLPVVLRIDEGGAIATSAAASGARRAPWLESFLRAEGPAALGHEIQMAQADVARLAARIEAQRKRVDEEERELEATARATEVADPADEAQARQMGRPPVPPPIGLGLQLFALALLLAETWQLGVPCLEAAGIRTHDLPGELHRNPVGVVLASLFVLGASASLFLFAHLALRRGLELVEGQPEARRRLSTGAAGTAAAALAIAMAWSISGMRPGANRPVDLGYARTTLFLVALAIPVTTACLLRVARRLDEARALALGLARAWDHEHYRSYADLSRRAAVLAEEERRLTRLEGDRAAALRRLRGLQQRSVAAERVAADAADEEEQQLAQLAQGIAASLELDRYEYVRQAAARGARVERRLPDAPPESASPTPVRAAADVEGRERFGLAG